LDASEAGADDVAVGTEGGGAGDHKAVLREVQVDRRVGPEIGNRQVVEALHDRRVVAGDGGVRIDVTLLPMFPVKTEPLAMLASVPALLAM
jgi:hypothetical protein